MSGFPAPRAPVQVTWERGRVVRQAGTIAWSEHVEAWTTYDAKCRCGQSAERIAERGGFSYEELVLFLGREPETWRPR